MPYVRLWSFGDICHNFRDISISLKLAAILDFQHEVASVTIAGDLDVSYIVVNLCTVFGRTHISVQEAQLPLRDGVSDAFLCS